MSITCYADLGKCQRKFLRATKQNKTKKNRDRQQPSQRSISWNRNSFPGPKGLMMTTVLEIHRYVHGHVPSNGDLWSRSETVWELFPHLWRIHQNLIKSRYQTIKHLDNFYHFCQIFLYPWSIICLPWRATKCKHINFVEISKTTQVAECWQHILKISLLSCHIPMGQDFRLKRTLSCYLS